MIISPTLPSAGSPRGSEEVDVRNALQALLTLVNGQLDGDNVANNSLGPDELTAAVREVLGVNSTGVVRRGKSIIATEESRTNTAYGTLPTPDQVSNVVLPTDGVILVVYQAMWKSSVAGAGRAALFLEGNQIKAASDVSTPQVQETTSNGTIYRPLHSYPGGLATVQGVGEYTDDVTTGQVIGPAFNLPGPGGACILFAAAGSYTVGVRFKASSGSVTAKARKLWVEARGY